MRNNDKLSQRTEEYLRFCTNRKNLDRKTIKSYRIDLRQYQDFVFLNHFIWSQKAAIESYIEFMHTQYKPKSVKRKIASIKAFFHYLEIEEKLEINPFHKIQIQYKEPFVLPKTIPIHNIESIISYAYTIHRQAATEYSRKVTLRNVLIIELLFATGMRNSELCSLKVEQINFTDYIIKIHGKGSKERLIQICNEHIQRLIDKYKSIIDVMGNEYFFTNRLHHQLSDQSVRYMISNYAQNANISQHITPHMFRHSFATLLLEEDVDIRYIQQMLGHSSITTTQIYTHTSISKQKTILATKHPRNQWDMGI